MKKRVFTAVVLWISLMLVGIVYAQSTPNGELDDVQTLKDKIASKVAELEKKDQRAVAGEIGGISESTIRLVTEDETTYAVKLDNDLTKFYDVTGGKLEEIEFSDFDKGEYIIVTGPIDGTSVTANSIYKDVRYLTGAGHITEVNISASYIKSLTMDKETFTLDTESTTQRLILNPKTLEIEKTTLAKIKEGDTIHFIYQKSGEEREKNRFTVDKILIIPQEYFIK